MSTDGREHCVGTLASDYSLNRFDIEWFYVSGISEIGVGHDCRRIRVHQNHSVPFAAEHAALSGLLPGDTALSDIAGFTVSGVPALSKLRADFDTSAGRALRHAEEDSDDGWNWLRQAFAGVVTFEPASSVALAAETIRTARRQLDVGEIRNAVNAVVGLSGRAHDAFATWREKAMQRAMLDDAMKSLNTRLLGAAAATPQARSRASMHGTRGISKDFSIFLFVPRLCFTTILRGK